MCRCFFFQITVNDYKKKGEVWSMDYGNMFEFFVRKDQRYQLQHTKDIHKDVQSFRTWVQRNTRRLADVYNKL